MTVYTLSLRSRYDGSMVILGSSHWPTFSYKITNLKENWGNWVQKWMLKGGVSGWYKIQNLESEIWKLRKLGSEVGWFGVACIWSISHTWWQKRQPSGSCAGFGLLKIEQLRSIFGRYKKSSDRPTPYQYSPLPIWRGDHYCSLGKGSEKKIRISYGLFTDKKDYPYFFFRK